MLSVAVAGGTGNLGKAIVKGLLDAKIDVIILARKTNPDLEKDIGAKIEVIDYEDEASIVSALEKNEVDTLICTLGSASGPEPEKVLIQAAERSSSTRRYIPSIWSMRYTPESAAIFPAGKGKLRTLQHLSTTSLEWTAVLNGFFLDYYMSPKIKSAMPYNPAFLDPAADTASIPGSGNTPIVLTHTSDIAKYVARLVVLDEWESQESIIQGDRVTFNELVHIAEEAKGRKFTIYHETMDMLKKGQVTELPSHRQKYAFLPKEKLQVIFAAFVVYFDNGMLDVQPIDNGQTLNDKFPDIKPRKVREMMFEAWRV